MKPWKESRLQGIWHQNPPWGKGAKDLSTFLESGVGKYRERKTQTNNTIEFPLRGDGIENVGKFFTPLSVFGKLKKNVIP